MGTASNQTIELLKYSSIACLVIAVALVILAVVLFFKLNIKGIIYELSGKARTDLTTKMTTSYEHTGSLRRIDPTSGGLSVPSGMIMTDRLHKKTQAAKADTSGSASTSVLKNTGTGQLRKVSRTPKQPPAPGGFTVTKDILVVHTDERI